MSNQKPKEISESPGVLAMREMAASAEKNSLSDMTLEEINAEIDAARRDHDRRQLEQARKMRPLDPKEFTEEELEKMKEIAPGEYAHIMEQNEKGK